MTTADLINQLRQMDQHELADWTFDAALEDPADDALFAAGDAYSYERDEIDDD